MRRKRRIMRTAALVLCVLGVSTREVPAQITTATVAGTVTDAQAAPVPGATVTLISETRGTTLGEAVTSAGGDFVFPNIPAATYTVQVALQGFRTLRRSGIAVSAGERVGVPTLTLEVGGLDETVEVTAQVPLMQAQSGERSATIPTLEVQNLPISSRNFSALVEYAAPGILGTDSNSRMGGGGQNNVTMDGVGIMDTGNNGQMLAMNVDAIAEVRVLSSGYQAEYGRSAGMQITAVTKSGTNQFRGSVYDLERNAEWNANSWVRNWYGDPKPVSRERDWGYTIGGPIGRPGGDNKLFFFYSHEYRPRETGGDIDRYRVPTLLERQGDFSQSRDSSGNLVNLIRDHTTGLACTPQDTRGCFQADGVLGRIPQDRLYDVGMNVLNMWPEPNGDGLDYNYESTRPVSTNLIQQPAIRVDYQPTGDWRFTARYATQRQRERTIPGTMPGFNDTAVRHPVIHNFVATVNHTLNATTFFEATYGVTQNRLAGGSAAQGSASGVIVSPASNRENIGLADLPLLFPDAGVVDPGYYAYSTLPDYDTPYFVDGRIMLPPVFGWGNTVANAPPNLGFPGWLNLNRTQDFQASLTKLFDRHTVKVGFYLNHAFKAENLNPGSGGGQFTGVLDFGNDSNNPLDTGFGFANAALGIFSSYQQHSRFVEGGHVYNNIEGYIQDNWKVTPRLTLDYGVRFTHMQPQHDSRMQASNFFPDRWDPARAPALFVPACPGNRPPCAAADVQAMDPLTGELLGPHTAYAVGQIVPGNGDLANGLVRQGDGISKYNYEWPSFAVGPRFGFAYGLDGTQSIIIRGAAGLFYDRPTGNSVFAQVGNPPFSRNETVRYAQLQALGQVQRLSGPSRLTAFQYDSKLPSSWQWNAGVQMLTPWSTVLDIAYVGQRGFNRLNTDHGAGIDINAVPMEAGYLPENQDPTRPPSDVPGETAVNTDLMRPLQGYGEMLQNWNRFWDEYHSIQTSLSRRFRDGLQFGVNYTLGLKQEDNRGIPVRLVHTPDGQFSPHDDQAARDALLSQGDLRRHVIRATFVWEPPNMSAPSTTASRILGAVVNDWQLSGAYRGNSGARYDIAYSYLTGGSNVNLTGSPSYSARDRIVGDPGSGCSDDQYRQFRTEAFAGPLPGSTGMESGRNYMVGCWEGVWDLAIARNFRLGGTRNFQVRLDVFNLFNNVIFNGRQTTMELVSPTDQTVRNAQFNADGTLNQSRLGPREAGFGAVTGAANMRELQLQLRFQF